MLFDLIIIRLCTSVVNSALRKKESPHNAYLVISEKPAWRLLRVLQGVDAKNACKMFHTACGLNDTHN